MFTTYIAAAFFAILAGIRLGLALQGDILALVLAAHAGIAAYLLVVRNPEHVRVSRLRMVLAWMSAFLPLTMSTSSQEHMVFSILSTGGVGFAVWALWYLGRSFGVAPSDRGLVQRGPYRFVRHPMYLGELFSFVVIAAGHPSWWNIVVLALTAITILLRIQWEEGLIAGYSEYTNSVRWRLIPYVW
jgi:protein-S-isoprenylcysteine O-methyltransferase Ste14